MKKLLYFLLGSIIILTAIMIGKTLTHPFAELSEDQPNPIKINVSEKSIDRFSKGLQFPTISFIDSSENNFSVYDSFLTYLRISYPNVFTNLKETLINKHCMLLHWEGENEQLKPILFMSHYDVVTPGDYEHDDSHIGQNMFELSDSLESETITDVNKWSQPPFSGNISEGKIYGRGAIDMKGVAFSLLESLDTLLSKGYKPKRDIYFAFNPDEEVGGLRGAAHLAKFFKSKNLTFESIYDEGGIVATPGTADGINQNIAFVGMGEKGVVSYRIKVKGTGGHSSMPPLETAAGKAAIIMKRLESNQFKQRLIEPTQNFLNVAGAGMGFLNKMVIANQWLFEGPLLKQLEKNPQANALTRTTTAITMLKGSDGNNVLPPVVEVVINFRILPGETSKDVIQHIEKACEGFEVEIDEQRVAVEPSKLSPSNGRAYEIIGEAIQKLYPGTLITPYITIGATDCKHMGDLSDRIYRFMPVLLSPEEQRSIHNYNEYLSIDNYGRMIAYYTYLIENFDSGK